MVWESDVVHWRVETRVMKGGEWQLSVRERKYTMSFPLEVTDIRPPWPHLFWVNEGPAQTLPFDGNNTGKALEFKIVILCFGSLELWGELWFELWPMIFLSDPSVVTVSVTTSEYSIKLGHPLDTLCVVVAPQLDSEQEVLSTSCQSYSSTYRLCNVNVILSSLMSWHEVLWQNQILYMT